MGFLNTQDLIAHHVALREASIGLQDPPTEVPKPSKVNLGESLEDKIARDRKKGKSIPSAIKFGSSEPIELYKPGKRKDSTTVSKVRAETTESPAKALVDKGMLHTKKKLAKPPALDVKIPTATRSVADSETEVEVSYLEGDNTELKLMRGALKYKDCVLDVPLGFVKNLSAYQRSRLEENGFHTVS